jgi:hypothetical protein
MINGGLVATPHHLMVEHQEIQHNQQYQRRQQQYAQ